MGDEQAGPPSRKATAPQGGFPSVLLCSLWAQNTKIMELSHGNDSKSQDPAYSVGGSESSVTEPWMLPLVQAFGTIHGYLSFLGK